MEDAELLTLYFKARSEAAFSQLVSRHLKLVYSAALRRLGGDRHAAEDVAQRVFTELARQAPRLANRTSLEGWLYTTTRNLVLQRIRVEQRRAARELEATLTMDEHDPAKADAEQLRPLIDAVLDRLGDGDREVILLRFYRGNAFAEIARCFGISEDAARFRLNRALERMKQLLQKRGIDSPPTALALLFADGANAATTEGLVNAVARGALAQASIAGHGGASLAHAVQLMSNTKVIVAAALLVACTGGSLLHREDTNLTEIRVELASRKNADQQTARQLANARVEAHRQTASAETPSEAQSTPTAPGLARDGSTPDAASASVIPSTPAPTGNAAVNWNLSRDPEIRAAFAAWIGSSIRANWSAFYRSANLSPEQIAAFETLMLENNADMGRAVLTLRPENKTLSQVGTDIHDLLGDAVYQQFQQYSRTQYVRAVTIGLAGFVHDTDAPLSAPQAEQLTQILAESSPNYKNGGFPFPKDIDWTAALSRAQSILTESQLTALNDLAELAPHTIGGWNPANPGKFGEGTYPPSSLYMLGVTSK